LFLNAYVLGLRDSWQFRGSPKFSRSSGHAQYSGGWLIALPGVGFEPRDPLGTTVSY